MGAGERSQEDKVHKVAPVPSLQVYNIFTKTLCTRPGDDSVCVCVSKLNKKLNFTGGLQL